MGKGLEMKKAVILAAMVAAAGAASAQTIEFNQLDGSFRFGIGGAFEAITNNVPGILNGAPFITFCLEITEQLNYNNAFNVVVNTASVNGGAGGGNPDPLSPQSAYLYQNYRNGTFTTTLLQNAAAGDLAQAMQVALWVLEDEAVRDTSGNGRTFRRSDNNNSLGNLNVTEFAIYNALLAEAAASGWTTLGNVRVANLSRNGNAAQDVLILIPLPQTVGLATAGLGLVALRRRRSA